MFWGYHYFRKHPYTPLDTLSAVDTWSLIQEPIFSRRFSTDASPREVGVWFYRIFEKCICWNVSYIQNISFTNNISLRWYGIIINIWIPPTFPKRSCNSPCGSPRSFTATEPSRGLGPILLRRSKLITPEIFVFFGFWILSKFKKRALMGFYRGFFLQIFNLGQQRWEMLPGKWCWSTWDVFLIASHLKLSWSRNGGLTVYLQ